MAAADLTRFDFYAHRFVNSENVQAMSLEEIGQYILLMCAAWLTGKDASLPDNPKALATICRGVPVTELVLSMFPVAPETGRRRNARLYEEWLEAQGRVENGREFAERRWGNRKNGKNGCQPNGNPLATQWGANAQTKPIQTKPSQEE